MGATTIWERWDGMKPDSTFQTPSMNSFNHYAYGAIGDWMYRTISGLKETMPGYKQFTIAPQPGGKFTNAQAELNTPYGIALSSWKISNGIFQLDVVVPPNTTAEVVLPKTGNEKITERQTNVLKSNSEKAGNDTKVKLGSGNYHFEYSWKPASGS
jgi:alpha-L-rhamnosidase